jgi:hypothetical protein
MFVKQLNVEILKVERLLIAEHADSPVMQPGVISACRQAGRKQSVCEVWGDLFLMHPRRLSKILGAVRIFGGTRDTMSPIP